VFSDDGDTFRKELSKFDMERAIPAWDGLATKQQLNLEILGVPTLFVTDTRTDLE